MIKVGKKTKAKYEGNITIEKIVQLDNPAKSQDRLLDNTNYFSGRG